MSFTVTVAIPTYRRGQVLIDTLNDLLAVSFKAQEILVVDQTEDHERTTRSYLNARSRAGQIVWLKLAKPSIPGAMNLALRKAIGEIVLFLDDDVKIMDSLIKAHLDAHLVENTAVVAGQVVQPWEKPLPIEFEEFHNDPDCFRFNSSKRQITQRVMACNMSVKRRHILDIGGFDENFVCAAYRFEAEFADRVLSRGYRILFEPRARIDHLKIGEGGVRSLADHLKTVKPHHTVGKYYYWMRAKSARNRLFKAIVEPIRSVCTKFHLLHPWWIPVGISAEIVGLLWAIRLWWSGPKLLRPTDP